MPDLSRRITECASPKDALLLVAKEFDRIEKLVGDVPKDEWDSWGDTTPSPSAEWTPDPEDIRAVGEIESSLHGCEDAEESKALRAQLELAKDKLKPPIEMLDNTGAHSNIVADSDGDAMVDLPPVSPEKEATRRQFAAQQLKLVEYYGEEEGAAYVDSYVKAGPLLLYYSDRDFILSLGDDIKRALVADVEEQSPKEAQEMARDILKDMDAQGPDITIENLVRTMGDA